MLVTVILATLMFTMIDSTSVVYADEISDLEQKIKNLNDKNKQIDGQLKDLGGKLEYEEESQAILKDKITNTQQQIALYEQKIVAMGDNIALKEAEISAKLVDISENEELFAQRVRSMYIAEASSSTLSYILSAKSFSEILTRAEILKRISTSDNDLINSLKTEKDELNAIKADMELQNAELTTTKTSLKKSSEELASMKAKSEQNEANLLATQEKYYKAKQANKKEIEANDKEIDRILAERASMGSAAPEGAYKWPVPSSSRITSPFGQRMIWNKPDFHTGIDIGAKSGSSILAAHDGTVVMVKKVNYGYGHHILIDHGGGQATLYAHCSRIDVKEGQTVKRGDVIGGVGTTGASTGNHLHFEVRIGGKKVDPKGYVTAP